MPRKPDFGALTISTETSSLSGPAHSKGGGNSLVLGAGGLFKVFYHIVKFSC